MREIEKLRGQVCICKAALLIIQAAVQSDLSREGLRAFVEKEVDDIVNDKSFHKWVVETTNLMEGAGSGNE